MRVTVDNLTKYLCPTSVVSPQLAARETVALQRRAVASSNRVPQGNWWRRGGWGESCWPRTQPTHTWVFSLTSCLKARLLLASTDSDIHVVSILLPAQKACGTGWFENWFKSLNIFAFHYFLVSWLEQDAIMVMYKMLLTVVKIDWSFFEFCPIWIELNLHRLFTQFSFSLQYSISLPHILFIFSISCSTRCSYTTYLSALVITRRWICGIEFMSLQMVWSSINGCNSCSHSPCVS